MVDLEGGPAATHGSSRHLVGAARVDAVHAGAPASPAETVRNWRYQFDADAAAGRDPTVGLHFTDSGEKVTACVRHQILVVQDGIADSCDAVVELTLPTSTDPPTSPSCRATPRSGRCAARHRRPMV